MDDAAQTDAAAVAETYGAHLPLAGDRLAGKVALISGAGGEGSVLGIGAATAVLFGAQGAAVILFDVDETRAETTRALVERCGGRARIVTGDVRSAGDCARAVQAAVDHFGGLDVLINNAAIARSADIDSVTEEIWDATIDINLKSVMLLSKAAVPALAVRGGAIVNLSSIAALQAFGTIAYAASKGGVISMTHDMAYTLGPRGIRVNCISPGHLATPMGGVHDASRRAMRRRVTMLGVEGTAWDAAWAALFLAGPESRWISGVNLTVDAGTIKLTAFSTLKAAEGAA